MKFISSLIVVSVLFKVGLFQSTSLVRHECGQVRQENIENRVLPRWVVRIGDLHKNNKLVAGGSLIRDDVVLTSAQHIHNKNRDDLIVESASGQRSKIRRIIVHENYSRNNRHDLALIFLEDAMVYTANVDTMCIFSRFIPQNCIGYSIHQRHSDRQTEVKVFKLDILPENECLPILKVTGLLDPSHPSAAHVCTTGDRSSDHCRGHKHDHGTGLFCPLEQEFGNSTADVRHYVQVGVSSWGQGCNGVPGMYTNINFFAAWIQETIEEEDESSEESDEE